MGVPTNVSPAGHGDHCPELIVDATVSVSWRLVLQPCPACERIIVILVVPEMPADPHAEYARVMATLDLDRS